MTTTIKSSKGPMHQDIYPIIARSQEELKKAYDQVVKFIKDKGGVDIYRILEGADSKLAGLVDGDIIIVPRGNKMETSKDGLTLVASYSGELNDVLPHFRFKTKRKWSKESLPFPPAPIQFVEKYADQETVRNRPDKAPPKAFSSSDGSITNSTPGIQEIYTCDIDKYGIQVFHYMPEYRKKKQVPSHDDPLVIMKVAASDKLSSLLHVKERSIVYEKAYSTCEILSVVYDLDDDSDMLPSLADIEQVHNALCLFLGDGANLQTQDEMKDLWHLYTTTLSMMKSYTELEFLSQLEELTSKARGKPSGFTKMCKEEVEKRELAANDDLETDRDLITDHLMQIAPDDVPGEED